MARLYIASLIPMGHQLDAQGARSQPIPAHLALSRGYQKQWPAIVFSQSRTYISNLQNKTSAGSVVKAEWLEDGRFRFEDQSEIVPTL